jgi:TM2 domain-containing membrane protein YozV
LPSHQQFIIVIRRRDDFSQSSSNFQKDLPIAKIMPTQTATCPRCSYQNAGFDNHCKNCGTPLMTQNPIPNYGGMQQMKPPGADKKIAAGICGILLGGFGVHKFVLGYQQEGIIMLSAYLIGLVLTFVTCGLAVPIPLAVSIIGLVEGIMYLTKSDEEFVQNYVIGKKSWF